MFVRPHRACNICHLREDLTDSHPGYIATSKPTLSVSKSSEELLDRFWQVISNDVCLASLSSLIFKHSMRQGSSAICRQGGSLTLDKDSASSTLHLLETGDVIQPKLCLVF